MFTGWEDYPYWQKTNPKVLKKINELIKHYTRTPFDGIGKPEALKGDLSGWWSRRIDHEHRLVSIRKPKVDHSSVQKALLDTLEFLS